MIKKFIKVILVRIDNQFKTSLYEKISKLIESLYGSNFLNAIRRITNPAVVRWKYKFGIKDKNSLKLHLGCGGRYFEDYINIDWRKTRATDLVCDIRKLPYPDNSVELIETYHVIEHLHRHDLPKALKEWYRVLVYGGRLIIECPDFDEIVKKYLEGDEKQLDGIFGLQRFEGDCHLFGYNFKRLKELLQEYGFTDVENKEAQDYHVKVEGWSCIRVECIKDVSSSSFMEKNCNLTFTGERVVEEETPQRIWLDHVARYKFASRYVKGKKVLDIACGTGYGSKILYDAGATKVVGVDISSETIDFACTKYKMNGLEFKVGNILDIDFPENYFEVITCFETIEHVQSKEKVFTELHRVLKPKGLLIISSPNRKLTSPGRSINDPPNNPFHVLEYSTDEFTSVLGNYFEISEVYGQRGINKLFFLSPFKRIMGKLLPALYDPEKGNWELEKISSIREYRYVTVVCKKSKSDKP